MAVLGIDFGTSYTFIVKLSEQNGKEKVELFGKQLYDQPRSLNVRGTDPDFYLKHSKGIKTWLALDNDGNWIAGKDKIEKAQQEGRVSEENICKNIKDLLRSCTSNDISNQSTICGQFFSLADGTQAYYSGIALAKEFFNAIVQENENSFNPIATDDIQAIVIGTPACDMSVSDKDFYEYRGNLATEVLPTICRSMGLAEEGVKLQACSEPVLAGYAYQKIVDVPDGRTLVIDIGGGTSDFAVIQKKNGKFSLFKKSKGGTLPAGASFNLNLQKLISSKFEVTISDDASLEALKEEMFLSPYSPRFCSDSGSKEDRIKSYFEYYNHGRRGIVTHEGRSCRVAFKEADLQGVPNDVGNGELWKKEDTAIWNTENGFRKVFQTFSESFKEFWKQITDDGRLRSEEVFQSVFFVGGTCAMFPLRYRICRELLGLTPIVENRGDHGEYTRVKGWERGERGEKEVPVIFPELESEFRLSFSNTIALGAAYFGARYSDGSAWKEVGLGIADIPELWLRFPPAENSEEKIPDFKLFSEQFKRDGSDGAGQPFIADYKKGEKFRFQIVRKNGDKEIVYPRSRQSKSVYYGGLPPKALRDKDYAVLIFADYEEPLMAIYVCYFDPKGNQNSVKEPVQDYIYQFEKVLPMKLREMEYYGECFACGISGIGKSGYCRKYVFSSGGDSLEGKLYAIRYNVLRTGANLPYGWQLKIINE